MEKIKEGGGGGWVGEAVERGKKKGRVGCWWGEKGKGDGVISLPGIGQKGVRCCVVCFHSFSREEGGSGGGKGGYYVWVESKGDYLDGYSQRGRRVGVKGEEGEDEGGENEKYLIPLLINSPSKFSFVFHLVVRKGEGEEREREEEVVEAGEEVLEGSVCANMMNEGRVLFPSCGLNLSFSVFFSNWAPGMVVRDFTKGRGEGIEKGTRREEREEKRKKRMSSHGPAVFLVREKEKEGEEGGGDKEGKEAAKEKADRRAINRIKRMSSLKKKSVIQHNSSAAIPSTSASSRATNTSSTPPPSSSNPTLTSFSVPLSLRDKLKGEEEGEEGEVKRETSFLSLKSLESPFLLPKGKSGGEGGGEGEAGEVGEGGGAGGTGTLSSFSSLSGLSSLPIPIHQPGKDDYVCQEMLDFDVKKVISLIFGVKIREEGEEGEEEGVEGEKGEVVWEGKKMVRGKVRDVVMALLLHPFPEQRFGFFVYFNYWDKSSNFFFFRPYLLQTEEKTEGFSTTHMHYFRRIWKSSRCSERE